MTGLRKGTRKKRQKEVRYRVLKEIWYDKVYGEKNFTTTAEIREKANVNHQQVANCCSMLRKLGFISKPDVEHPKSKYTMTINQANRLKKHFIGRARVKHTYCKHLTTKLGKKFCPIKQVYISDPEYSCELLHTIIRKNGKVIKDTIPVCEGYCGSKSTAGTKEFSSESILRGYLSDLVSYHNACGYLYKEDNKLNPFIIMDTVYTWSTETREHKR